MRLWQAEGMDQHYALLANVGPSSPIFHSSATQQCGIFATLGRASPAYRNGTRRSLALVRALSNAYIHVTLEETEVFVQNAEENDGDKGQDESDVGADVPGRKDDASINDLGVPEHMHGTHGGHVVPIVPAVVHSEVLVSEQKYSRGGYTVNR